MQVPHAWAILEVHSVRTACTSLHMVSLVSDNIKITLRMVVRWDALVILGLFQSGQHTSWRMASQVWARLLIKVSAHTNTQHNRTTHARNTPHTNTDTQHTHTNKNNTLMANVCSPGALHLWEYSAAPCPPGQQQSHKLSWVPCQAKGGHFRR